MNLLAYALSIQHQNITTTFESAVKSEKSTVVLFYTPWCQYFLKFEPVWDSLVNDKVIFAYVDCTISRNICQEENIQGYPTLRMYHNGEFVERYRSKKSSQDILKWIDLKVA